MAFKHGNRGKKPKQIIPEKMKKHTLKRYLSYGTYKPNILHVCERLAEEEGILLSNTRVKKRLYQEPSLSPQFQRKTKKRLKKRAKKKEDENLENLASPAAENFLKAPKKIHPSRPRKKFVGELIPNFIS